MNKQSKLAPAVAALQGDPIPRNRQLGKALGDPDQAQAWMAKVEKSLAAAKEAEKSLGERANEAAFLAEVGELSKTEADAIAQKHADAARDLQRCESTLKTAKGKLDAAEQAVSQQVHVDQINNAKLAGKELEEGAADTMRKLEAFAASLPRVVDGWATMAKLYGSALPADVWPGLTRQLALDFAAIGPGSRLLGNQRESDKPVLPGAASRSEIETARIGGRAGGLVEVTRQALAFVLKRIEAGGELAKPTPDPVDVLKVGDLEKMPGWLRNHLEQALGADLGKSLSRDEIIRRTGIDPSAMAIGTKNAAELLAEHQAANPKRNMAAPAPSRRPVETVETPRPARQGLDPAVRAALDSAVAAARKTKSRPAVRAALDAATGVPGAEADMIPAEKVGAFLESLGRLPDASGDTPVERPVEQREDPWIGNDDA